jgi:hypothetical protein
MHRNDELMKANELGIMFFLGNIGCVPVAKENAQ